jgi:hypothetical protein
MKKSYLLLSAIVIFLASCKDKDSPVLPHEVGVWELDSYLFINFPTGFEDNDGSAFELNQLTFGGATYNEYILNLKSDGTFVRNIDIPGPDIEDSGKWELSDETLTLDSDDNGESEWKVEKNEDQDLWISFETQNAFLPDIYFDTVTQAYIDYLGTLTSDQLDSVANVLSEVVLFDLVFVLERQ